MRQPLGDSTGNPSSHQVKLMDNSYWRTSTHKIVTGHLLLLTSTHYHMFVVFVYLLPIIGRLPMTMNLGTWQLTVYCLLS